LKKKKRSQQEVLLRSKGKKTVTEKALLLGGLDPSTGKRGARWLKGRGNRERGVLQVVGEEKKN